ncbi:P-loop containing nucleoside triphosphate hydrolase protein [Coprinellus micaceus]|uniref:P-loop containing nucleoside triphosphate hydrolase protein n=1 Tax=Coprinellus micaceus TaxID=71717 RepID=A0A4Y7SMY0_COPMI|nr:P-loop containing nucleoside triphosphate hydrolase protein [Coprinellus micaceus]
MPKRPATVETDSGSDSERGTPKRTRRQPADDSDSDQAGPSQRNGRQGRGRRARNEEDSDAEAEVVVPVAVDDEEFENAHRDRIRRQLESNNRAAKGQAEYGIIESIECVDFMCHERLFFEFGPQINFIIGHNGSGKSAVLSGLTLALGGKTNSTGRGSGLKSFIREGTNASKITLTIKNQGPEAYKPNEYGQSIVIERRFTKEGSSSWKLMNEDGKTTVSNKREELSAICDHMNIQVDNPLNVLTQDAARQFLSGSQPTERYKFFLLGTQLFQLSQEYDTCLDNIRKTSKVLQTKKEAIPDLRRHYNEVVTRFKEAEKAVAQKKKVDDLKKELAWAHVKTKEDELKKAHADLAAKKKNIPKVEEKIAGSELELEEKESVVKACEDERKELGSVGHLQERKNKFADELRDKRKTLRTCEHDLVTMRNQVSTVDSQISGLERALEEEKKKMEADSRAKRAHLEAEISRAKADIAKLEAEQEEIRNRRESRRNDMLQAQQAGDQAKAQVEAHRTSIISSQTALTAAKASERDTFVPYGNNIKAVVEEIDRSTWYGDKPVGPLGRYVKAREPSKWGDILRTQLGQLLTAFAVTDARDRDQLKRILLKHRNTNNIIISERDLFDFRSGEPPEKYLTVLRALDISDDWVVRLLINQGRIENTVLSESRRSLENELKELHGGVGWSRDQFNVRVFPEGGASSHGLQIRKNDAQSLLLTGRNAQAEIAHHEAALVTLNQQLQQVTQALQQAVHQATQLRRELDGPIAREEQAKVVAIRNRRSDLNTLQSEYNDEVPANSAGLLHALEEAQAEKTSLLTQKETSEKNKATLQTAVAELEAQLAVVNGHIGEYQEKLEGLTTKLQTAITERVQVQNDIKHWTQRLAKEKDLVKTAESHAKVTEEEFDTWTKAAEQFCSRVETTRTPETIERESDSVRRALEAREKRQGATVEELTAQVNKAKDAMDKAEGEWKSANRLNKALRTSLLIRLHRWQEFRSHISLRCKLIFSSHLAQRGYFGKVLFNHEAQTLTLRVQTDDQLQKGTQAEKDPKSLSGGEKSFSTICLLLSLWDSIGCPLRCLDEFDVFMDAVNRRISMKMMIDTANANPDKQYILITPQDMTNIRIGDNVRVNRMLDPVRRTRN